MAHFFGFIPTAKNFGAQKEDAIHMYVCYVWSFIRFVKIWIESNL